jgi:brefeldin A-inhibited guanine nucleotide-exchange protein
LDCVGKLIDYGYLADHSVFKGSQLDLSSTVHSALSPTSPEEHSPIQKQLQEGEGGIPRSDSTVSESTLSYVELPDTSRGIMRTKKADQNNVPITYKPAKKERKPLIDTAIDIICDCFFGEHTDENVQMQIIKVL